MKGLLRFELKRRWRSPGTWLFLAITLFASGTACLLKNVYAGSSGFETIFNWAMYSLMLGCPLLTWGVCTADRKNDAWKMLFSRGISPLTLAFVRLIGVWSACLVSAVCMLAGPAALCLHFDSLYFPGALCAAAAYLSVSLLASAFCLWMEACAQRAWQAALSGAIALVCVYFMSLLAIVALSSSGGAILAIAILAFVILSMPVLLGGSFRSGFALALLFVLGMAAVLLFGGRTLAAQTLTKVALFDQMNVFMLGIFDLSVVCLCILLGVLFAFFAGAAMLCRRQSRAVRFPSRPLRLSAAALAVCLALTALLPLMGPALRRIDATRVRTSTPVPQAEEVLNASDVPVHAYFLTTTDDVWMEALLARYAGLSDRFTYSFVDLTVNPDFGENYYGARGQDNCLILTSSDRYVVLPSVYIYTYTYAYDSSTGNYVPTDLFFDAQSRILTAVNFLSAEDVPTIGALSGHFESQIGEYARDAVYTSGGFIRYLDLSRDTLDENIDCVLIQNPLTDITAEERDLLIAYLQNGGGLMLSTNYQYNSDCPNLFSVMEYCGMAPRGLLAMEPDASAYLDYGYYPAPIAAGHAVTAAVAGNRVIVPTAHGLTLIRDCREDLVCTPLLTMSNYSYLKNSAEMTTLDFEEGDLPGPVTLAIAAEDEAMRAVWVSGDHLADSAIITTGGSNLYFWLGEVQWACGKAGVSPYIAADAPSLTTTRLRPDDMQKLTVTAASLLLAVLSLITAASLGRKKIRSSRGA